MQAGRLKNSIDQLQLRRSQMKQEAIDQQRNTIAEETSALRQFEEDTRAKLDQITQQKIEAVTVEDYGKVAG